MGENFAWVFVNFGWDSVMFAGVYYLFSVPGLDVVRECLVHFVVRRLVRSRGFSFRLRS